MNSNSAQPEFPRLLTDNLWVLGNYFFNLYLVRGRKAAALIEAGISATVDAVIDQLENLQIEPDYLVLTHPHSDHFTGLPGLRERFPRAAVVTGSGAREFVQHPKAAGMMIAEDRFMSRQLAARGIVPGRPPLERIEFPPNHTAVDEALVIDLGGLTLECQRVDGHAPGNIVVHLPQLHTLILSDSLGFHFPGRGFCPLFFTGYPDYMATLERLAALQPKIIGPAHQGPLFDRQAGDALSRARQDALDLHARIISAHERGEDICGRLFKEYYQDEFKLYSPANIESCVQLLVRRALESA